jgi:hypothetical protein
MRTPIIIALSAVMRVRVEATPIDGQWLARKIRHGMHFPLEGLLGEK